MQSNKIYNTSNLIEFIFLQISINVNISTPHTSGMTAIELWMIMCVVMVFAALCEYGVLIRIASNKKKIKPQNKSMKWNLSLKLEDKNEPGNDTSRLRKIDNVSLIVFPTTFSIFVLMYSIWVQN